MALGRKLGSLAGIATAALLFAAGPASATITVDGITFGEGAVFKTGAIWENVVDTAGQTLTGMGIVTQIVGGDCGGVCWADGDNGRELTFTFTYTLEKITALDADTGEAWFSGGTLNFYVDPAENFTYGFGANQAADLAAATDGTQWLNLFGAQAGADCVAADGCFSGAGTEITLVSNFEFAGDLGAVLAGDGAGFFDVVAGPGSANAYFNSNTQPSGQDMGMDTDFRADDTESNFPLTGSASLRARTAVAVPEPGTLAVLGFGLLGLSWMRRRKVRV